MSQIFLAIFLNLLEIRNVRKFGVDRWESREESTTPFRAIILWTLKMIVGIALIKYGKCRRNARDLELCSEKWKTKINK